MKRLSLLLLSFLVLACGNKIAEKPEKLLSEKEMENILYDITLLQAIRSYTPSILNKNNVDAKNYVYRKYNIDSITLAQNHKYYASDLEKYEELQKRVSERLEKERDKWQKGTKADKKTTKKSLKSKSSTSIKSLGTGRSTMTQDNESPNPAH